MLVEMSIYLAYYKDVIFSLITLVNFVGMYIHNQGPSHQYVQNCLIALISISSAFILMTVLHDYDKAFYLKYKLYFRKFNSLEKDKHKSSKKKQKATKSGLEGGADGGGAFGGGGADENQLYERSQSFAVWLQFQNIQAQKVLVGDTESIGSSEIDEDMEMQRDPD
jgi:hypothetical protein